MNNLKNGGPGGLRNRETFVGGRPKSDADYGAKKKFGKKSSFGNNRNDNRGDRSSRGSFGGDRGGERRQTEMFKTTCTSCGKAAEVPFRPDGSKPVLCRDCFAQKSDSRGESGMRDRFSNNRGNHKPERSFDTPRPDRGLSLDYKALLSQVHVLEGKVNEILIILKTTTPIAPTVEVKAEVVAASVKEKKIEKVAAKKVAKKVIKKVTTKVATKKVTKKVAKK